MQIQARAIVEPIYFNASDKYFQWHTDNSRRLEAYWVAWGGATDDIQGFLEFARYQFDRQVQSPRDLEHRYELQDMNARA